MSEGNNKKKEMLRMSFLIVCFITIIVVIVLSRFYPLKSLNKNYVNRTIMYTTSVQQVNTTVSPLTTLTVSNNSSTQSETPMMYITAGLIGRLGNQMFEYATVLGLARAQKRMPFIKGGGDLINTFQITLVNNDINTTGWKVMGESGYATFDSRFMKLPVMNLIIGGYLQCWRYFIHAQDELRREFTLNSTLQKYAQGVLKNYRSQLDNHVIVGVHVRRGDFLTQNGRDFGYGVPNASYFTNAFSKMRSLLSNQNITFLVASEDLDWCKNNLNDSCVRMLPLGSAAEHFAILSSCDHVILSGGTYGWWSAWLANGISIYFLKYIPDDKPVHNGFTEGDYYPLGWIGLDN